MMNNDVMSNQAPLKSSSPPVADSTVAATAGFNESSAAPGTILPAVSAEETHHASGVPSAGTCSIVAVKSEYDCDTDDDVPATKSSNNVATAAVKSEYDCDTDDEEGASNETAASATNDNDNTTDTEPSFCRFLITDLKAGRGYAKSNYQIDLIKSKHGLFDIVTSVYKILHREKLTYDSIYSHLWDLQFAGKKYRNGWRRQRFPGDTSEFDRPANKTDLDSGERRLLNGLEKAIEKGQKGWCSGESARFTFVVEDVDLKVEGSFDSSVYPRITAVPIQLSAKVEDDWITSDEKSQAASLSSAWQRHLRGENSWKRDRYSREYVRCKPNHNRMWGPNETEIMGLLLNAGAKFKKSWTSIMQYACVDRAETAASYQWYKLQKEAYRREYVGRGLNSGECIRLAKRLAKSMLSRQLEAGAPQREPHPNDRLESLLRKRRKIDDTTSEAEKMELIRDWRGLERELEDSDFDSDY